MKKYGGDPAKGERPDMRMCKWDGSGADSGLLFHVHPRCWKSPRTTTSRTRHRDPAGEPGRAAWSRPGV